MKVVYDAKPRNYPPPDPVYKGYVIKKLLSGDSFSIQKDGFHIGYASSVEDAKKTIDEVAG